MYVQPRILQHLRQGLGLSLDKPAEKIGVDSSTVRRRERLGYRPHPRLFARLAKILNIPEPPEDAPLRDRLRARRLALGLTQAEAATQIGVSQDPLSRWEVGRIQPRLEEIRQTRRILGVELSAKRPATWLVRLGRPTKANVDRSG